MTSREQLQMIQKSIHQENVIRVMERNDFQLRLMITGLKKSQDSFMITAIEDLLAMLEPIPTQPICTPSTVPLHS